MASAAQNTPQPGALVRSEVRVVSENGPLGYLVDTAKFEHGYRVAKAIACQSFIPAHLKGQSHEEAVANCFRIYNQAMRWGLDPFALCDETYVVKGKLGYQGKLVAGVINALSDLQGGLRKIYNNRQGNEFAVVVYGSTSPIPQRAFDFLAQYADDGNTAALMELSKMNILATRLTVGQGRTDNKMWTSDPEQKLWYSCATKWARSHRPEIILGVMADDDLDRQTATVIEEERKPLPSPGRHSVPKNGQNPPPAPEPVVTKTTEPVPSAPEPEQMTYGEGIADLVCDLTDTIDQAETDADFQDAATILTRHESELGSHHAGLVVKWRAAREAKLGKPKKQKPMFAGEGGNIDRR